MQRIFFFSFLFIFVFFIKKEALLAQQPLLLTKTDNLKLGKVDANTLRTIQLIYQNAGKTPLIIQKITTHCGCTVVDFSKSPLLPQQSDTLLIQFKDATEGRFSKQIQIYYNSHASPKVITLHGRIINQ